jgi:nucleotide-binding universal stress UspA family protein
MITFANKKIVVPVDFSEQADLAVQVALKLADRPTQVHVIHVGVSFGAAVDPPFIYPVVEKRLESPYEKSFRDRYDHPKFHGIVLAMKYGEAGQEIANYAKQIGAGLIIMPSHGRCGLPRVLIGSVAERVVRFAPCPVLVLRGLSHGNAIDKLVSEENKEPDSAVSLRAL